ncbi:MAG: GntP family permease [Halanaerobiaceae bacterium]
MLGIGLGFLILIILITLKINIVVAAPVAATIIAVVNDLNILQVMNEFYLPGFGDFIQSYLFIFLLSAMLGQIIESSQDADYISDFVVEVLNYKYMAVGIFFTSALLGLGGISAFVLIFSIYPIADRVFEKVGLSQSLILAAVGGGIVVIAIPLPGSPQIHNLIMMDFLNNTAVTGLVMGVVSVLVGTVFSAGYLFYRTRNLLDEESLEKANSVFNKPEPDKLKNFLISISPLLLVFTMLAFFDLPPVLALASGVVLSMVKNIRKIKVTKIINDSISQASIPMLFAASAMGFGEVISNLPVFTEFLQVLLNLPLHPLILVGVINNMAAGLLGTASGGMLLTLSTVGEELAQSLDSASLHRIFLIGATGLDTLPHNSAYLAMLSFTGLTLKETYRDYFVITVLAPLLMLVTALIIAL